MDRNSTGSIRFRWQIQIEHKARQRDPERLADCVKRDRALERGIQRIWEKNFKVYGADKVWRQLLREGIRVACCTVERLMKKLGIQSVRRGKSDGRQFSLRKTWGDSVQFCGTTSGVHGIS